MITIISMIKMMTMMTMMMIKMMMMIKIDNDNANDGGDDIMYHTVYHIISNDIQHTLANWYLKVP